MSGMLPEGPEGQRWIAGPADLAAGDQPGGAAGPHWRPEWGPGPGGGTGSLVPQQDTRVTGRRAVQYVADAVLSSAVPVVLDVALGRRALALVGAAALSIVIYVWYWVIRPHRAAGQTFGMQLLGIRVISSDGRAASMAQLTVRWLLLILDGLAAGLVGLVVMLCSPQRQRIGDQAAKTLVVRTDG